MTPASTTKPSALASASKGLLMKITSLPRPASAPRHRRLQATPAGHIGRRRRHLADRTLTITRQPRLLRCALPLLAAILAGCAATPASTPSALTPPPGHRELATIAARGVQRYECRLAGDAPNPAWVFVAPDAELFDRAGRRIGSH